MYYLLLPTIHEGTNAKLVVLQNVLRQICDQKVNDIFYISGKKKKVFAWNILSIYVLLKRDDREDTIECESWHDDLLEMYFPQLAFFRNVNLNTFFVFIV